MSRRTSLALAGLLLAIGAARAEPPHLELVRGLRANGMPDLALDYLQRLGPKASPEVAALVPVEIARIKIDVAEQEGDDKKRLAAIAAARPVLEAFLKANPKHPLAADVTVELAKLLSVQGKIQLVQARRLDGAAKQTAVAKVRPLFQAASAQLAAAAKQIDDQLGKADAGDKAALTRAKFQAQLESGITQLDEANTVADLKERAKIVGEAKKKFEALGDADENSSVSWQAKVWVGRALQEQDSTPDARKVYDAVAAETSPAAAEAVRLATYLQLDLRSKDTQIPPAQLAAHTEAIVKDAEAWLKKYRGAINTFEGQGIRYLLAVEYDKQAKPGITQNAQTKLPQVSAAARNNLAKAEKLLKELADGDNDFSGRARIRRQVIIGTLIAERGGAIERLVNFEECYLAAQVGAYESTQMQGDDARKKMRYVVRVLQRGLSLAGAGDPPRDVFDARVMLAYGFMASGDPYSAAVLGEHLARTSGGNSRGAEATFYALQAYARILTGSRDRGAPAEEVQSDLNRLKRLAQHMEETWPEEAATDTARHQLGALYLEENNPAEAVRVLSRIGVGYPGLATARYQEGVAAQIAQGKDSKVPVADRKKLMQQAIADLGKVPDAPPGGAAESFVSTAQARLQLATLLLLAQPDAKGYERVEGVGKALKEALPKQLAADDDKRDQLVTEAGRIQLAGLSGRAYLLVKADKTEEALKLLGPSVAGIEAEIAKRKKPAPDAEPPKPWTIQYRQAERDVLLLVLRAGIQEGNVGATNKAMASLKAATAGEGQDALNGLLLRVVQELKAELDGLRRDNKDADRQAKLEKGLIGFLDELAKPANLTAEVRLFLAQGYASLDRHAEAAKLLTGLPQPKADDAEAVRTFRGAKLLQAREQRLARQYPGSQTTLKEIMGTPANKGWGFDNLDVRKEAVLLLEDMENYKAAVNMATDMQKRLQSAMADNPQLRERFYDFYFLEVRCLMKQAKAQKTAKERQDGLGRLAVRIVKLEQGQPDFGGEGFADRYRELIAAEDELKGKYVAEGGKLFAK